jgi:hypothetical protein
MDDDRAEWGSQIPDSLGAVCGLNGDYPDRQAHHRRGQEILHRFSGPNVESEGF